MAKRTLVLLAAVALLVALPARAQLLWVTGNYRVVALDQHKHRIGVNLVDAPQDARRQNWAYLDLNTKLFVKTYDAEGWAKEVEVPASEILGTLKIGDKVLINGGRGMDLSIAAKKIWFDPKAQ